MENNELQEPKRTTLKYKIWKSLIALGVFAGLISITDIKIKIEIWIIIIILSVIAIVIYWHLLERLIEKVNKVKKYFINIKEDIKFIKNNIKGGNKNE